MIDKSKKITAFDLLEAAMELSKAYHKSNANRSVSISYCGKAESFDLRIFEWNESGSEPNETLATATVYLDADFGDSFEKAFEIIVEEMEKIENL